MKISLPGILLFRVFPNYFQLIMPALLSSSQLCILLSFPTHVVYVHCVQSVAGNGRIFSHRACFHLKGVNFQIILKLATIELWWIEWEMSSRFTCVMPWPPTGSWWRLWEFCDVRLCNIKNIAANGYYGLVFFLPNSLCFLSIPFVWEKGDLVGSITCYHIEISLTLQTKFLSNQKQKETLFHNII